jgi:C-terminal processing protease CtpA/Prc
MMRQRTSIVWLALVVAPLIAGVTVAAKDEKLTKRDRVRAVTMLQEIQEDIKRYYYDPAFHGLDLGARFQEAREKIESAPTLNYAFADIAGAVSALNDSHTVFLPPPRPYEHYYGWRILAIGDSNCFVTAVQADSDFEKKGVRPGDQVLTIDGHPAIREDLWKINYLYSVLRPQIGLRLQLRSPDGATREVNVMAHLRPTRQVETHLGLTWDAPSEQEHMWHSRSVEYGKKAIIWQLANFTFDPNTANEMLDKIRSHDALVLDLRGNPGGYSESLSHLLGGMFDHEVKIADRVMRKSEKPDFTKTRKGKTFTGKLVVLIDSKSASAAELFARVVQLQERGTVVGDRSSGRVMESEFHQHEIGFDLFTFYGAYITNANLIMTDGNSLEHTGAIPDERVLPTPVDLAAGRDPALVRAAALAGINLTPEEADKLFPLEWPKD